MLYWDLSSAKWWLTETRLFVFSEEVGGPESFLEEAGLLDHVLETPSLHLHPLSRAHPHSGHQLLFLVAPLNLDPGRQPAYQQFPSSPGGFGSGAPRIIHLGPILTSSASVSWPRINVYGSKWAVAVIAETKELMVEGPWKEVVYA